MCADLLEAGLAAPLFEPVAKGLGRVRFSKRRHQVNQVAGGRRIDALAQWRQNWQFMLLDDPRAALRLGKNELLHFDRVAVGRCLTKPTLHLRAEPDDIATPYPGIKQQIES